MKKIFQIIIVVVVLAFAAELAYEAISANQKSAYGQSTAPFANCIQLKMEGQLIQLVVDKDCDKGQFIEAVAYYKANGYPVEGTYMDFQGAKMLELRTQQFSDDVKALGLN